MAKKLASAFLRVPTGAFILNSGIGKLGLKGEAAEGLQGFAATGIPALGKLDPDTFGKFISYSEIGIGASLLAPFVPNKLAGAAVAAFGSGLLTLYFNNDNMTEEDGIRPSEDGIAIAKDSWLVGIGAALIALGSTKK
ncbi:Uncharacterised protein [Corynebacterium renale]|uniref:DoxX-like protein n=1 Tax=Corynebacterium renale TaxID=1724 RepID=A0A2A9DMK1_9CORY|nr:hypothetical protein [Corynebacterium renale]PFG27601.1 hypothetical protein ATK06_0672 [Corynebacterium renale]SQG63696.1 Uncharacterised protein [Corynebacterium renale]SQI22976.1 Uncharacterised protein [Corynebacterium renale]STD01634.1 Uncharacterised protein [Corynebacterium renale]